jgi:hypothetical protein
MRRATVRTAVLYSCTSPASHVHRSVTCSSFSFHYSTPYPLPSYCPHTSTWPIQSPVSLDKHSIVHFSHSHRSAMKCSQQYKQLCTPEHFATLQFPSLSVTQFCRHPGVLILLPSLPLFIFNIIRYLFMCVNYSVASLYAVGI